MKKILIASLFGSSLTMNSKAQDTARGTLSVSGYIETYYSYDFNKPVNNERPAFLYSHTRANEVNLNIGLIRLSYTAPRTRASLALAAGTYMNANYAAEPGVLKNLYEGYAGYKLSGTADLWLDAGIFASHLGFESAIGKDCWNLTRSIPGENSPYFESGVRLGYTSTNGKWYLSALMLNGWQRIHRPAGNTTPAFGTQVTYKPSEAVTLNYGNFIGNDKPDSVKQMRYFHNLYGIFQFDQRWAATAGFDFGFEQRKKGNTGMNNWFSPVVMLKYKADARTTLVARAEYYQDKSGVIIATGTPDGFQTWGYSLNFDYALTSNALWRTEIRSFSSKDKIFAKDNGLSASNTAFTTSFAISF